MEQFEISSNASDCPSSNLSSLSGLTGFEEEFYDLKSVIRDTPDLVCTQSSYINERSKLNAELQRCLKLNEKYKNDLYNLERQVELASHEKFQKLSSYNSQLEARLEIANKRISELSKASVDDVEVTLRGEIKRLKNKADELEFVNNKLKLNLEEIKIDVDTKNNSVVGLKGKIVDLHVEMQALTSRNIKLSNELNLLHNNFNSCKKSEVWYKEQLHQCREQKSHLSEEMSRLHSLLIVRERDLNARNNDFLRLNTVLEEVQAAYHRSKDAVVVKVESRDDCKLDAYESTIETLSAELVALKEAVDAQQSAFDVVTKQNCELVAFNAALENGLRKNETLVFNLENNKKDLCSALEVLNAKLADLNRLVLTIGNEKSHLEIALEEAKREKAEIEDAVATIRDNFSKFANLYKQVKVELIKSNRCKTQLEEAKSTLESNNEKLAIEVSNVRNELNSCTKHKQELALEINKSADLNQQLRISHGRCVDYERLNKSLEGDNCILKEKLTEQNVIQRNCELVRVKSRLLQIEDKCKQLQGKNAADDALLREIVTDRSDNADVKHLKALCKAKDLESKENRRRYEANCRTLLRKVKEHIRGRNAAEKRCTYLQELHDNVFEELNSCKLQQATQALDLENMQSERDNSKNTHIKTKRQLLQLQNQFESQHNTLRDQDIELSKQIVDLNLMQNEKEALLEKLKESNDELATLQVTLERESKSKREIYEDWVKEQQQNLYYSMQLDETTGHFQQQKVENEMLAEEVARVTMKLTCHTNELTELREQKIFLETKRKLEEIIISNLKSDIQILQNDLATVKSDKYFLQRLCNDLKFALTTLRNQSEVLKKQITTLDSRDRLPDIQEVPSPCKYDEAFITELLKQSITPVNEKPLCDLHNSLTLLKKEMIALRKQVINYNI